MLNQAKEYLPDLSLRIAVPAFRVHQLSEVEKSHEPMSKSEVLRVFARDLTPETEQAGEPQVETPEPRPGSMAEHRALRAALYPEAA